MAKRRSKRSPARRQEAQRAGESPRAATKSRVPDFAAYAGICILLALFFWRAGAWPPYVIGDGREYLCMARNWFEHHTPWISQASIDACLAQSGAHPVVGLVGWVPHGAQYDAFHFWLLSLLAAPFVGVCSVCGISFRNCFTLFHLTAAFYITRRLLTALGPARTLVCWAAIFCSPLIFFIDKAHAEFFLCSAILLALAALYRGAILEAALWMALGSSQQTLFVPFAGGLFAAWLWSRRFHITSVREAAGAAATLLLLGASPLYYLLRYGTLSLQASLGFVIDPRLISFRRAASLFADPDLGLFPNWPAGLALLLCCIGFAAALRRRPPGSKAMGVFTAALLLLLPFMTCVSSNWNSGGTLYISRYATFYIPVVAFWFAVLAFRFRDSRHSVILAIVFCVPWWYGFRWNLARYSPKQPENYLRHTPFAEWLYRRHPGVYDPIPEVFVERSIGVEMLPGRIGGWAVGNASCNKLYLLRTKRQLQAVKMTEREQPAGCVLPVDGQALAAEIEAGTRKITAGGYVNLPVPPESEQGI